MNNQYGQLNGILIKFNYIIKQEINICLKKSIFFVLVSFLVLPLFGQADGGIFPPRYFSHCFDSFGHLFPEEINP